MQKVQRFLVEESAPLNPRRAERPQRDDEREEQSARALSSLARKAAARRHRHRLRLASRTSAERLRAIAFRPVRARRIPALATAQQARGSVGLRRSTTASAGCGPHTAAGAARLSLGAASAL